MGIPRLNKQNSDKMGIPRLNKQNSDKVGIPRLIKQNPDKVDIPRLIKQNPDKVDIPRLIKQNLNNINIPGLNMQNLDKVKISGLNMQNFLSRLHTTCAANNCGCHAHSSCQDNKRLQQMPLTIVFRSLTPSYRHSKEQPTNIPPPSPLGPNKSNNHLTASFLPYFPRTTKHPVLSDCRDSPTNRSSVLPYFSRTTKHHVLSDCRDSPPNRSSFLPYFPRTTKHPVLSDCRDSPLNKSTFLPYFPRTTKHPVLSDCRDSPTNRSWHLLILHNSRSPEVIIRNPHQEQQQTKDYRRPLPISSSRSASLAQSLQRALAGKVCDSQLSNSNTGEGTGGNDHFKARSFTDKHLETSDKAEHLETSDKTEHLETSDKTEHLETSDKTEHLETSDKAEHLETSDKAEHLETSDKTEHLETSDKTEHLETSDKTEHLETSDKAEHLETSDKTEHLETSDKTEHLETSDKTEHLETSDKTEHLETSDKTEHLETSDKTEHLETSDKTEHLETSDKTEHLETSDKTEHQETDVDDMVSILSSLKLHKSHTETVKDTVRKTTQLNFMDNPLGFRPGHELVNITVNMLRNSAHGIPWKLFERETMRMASFAFYPASAAKPATLLASSGFVYIGDGVSDRVKCVFCSAEKESWQERDNIDQVHLSLNPTCPMVIVQSTNNVASNNSTHSMDGIADYSSAVPCSEDTPMSRPLNPNNSTSSVRDEAQNTAAGNNASRYDDVDSLSSYTNEALSDDQEGSESLSTERSDSSSGSQLTPPNTNSNAGRGTNRQAARRSTLGLAQGQSNRRSTRRRASNRRANNLSQGSNRNTLRNENNLNAHNFDISSSGDQVQQVGNPVDVPSHQNINSQIYSIPVENASNTQSSCPPATPGNTPAPSEPTPPQLTYQMLGIYHERPTYIEYAVLARRLQTFEAWPEGHPLRKEDLAKSGLFFAGYGDCCRCFFCGGGLRNWMDEDDVFVEHARWFGKCSFLRQCVGEDFVKAVQALGLCNDTIKLVDVTEYMSRMGQPVYNSANRRITEDAAVRSIIQAGYDTETVSRVANSVRENGDFLSADVILRAMREEELGASAAAPNVVEAEQATEDVLDEERLQTLKDQNHALRNNLICKICMDKEVRIVFLPCGHLVSCQDCAVALQDCPVCRRHIRATALANIH